MNKLTAPLLKFSKTVAAIHENTNPVLIAMRAHRRIQEADMSIKNAVQSVNPVKLIKTHVHDPVHNFVEKTIRSYKERTNEGINSIREVLYRSGIAAVFASAVLWLSIFLYVVFYYTYMPNITHMRPVHLQFKSCDEQPGVCSFPSAHVQLTHRHRVLMIGQPYRIRLTLDMPETQTNKDLGMFMVCAQLRTRAGALVSSSCRSAMLRHRSGAHALLRAVLLAPLLLGGLSEEKQRLQVELFGEFMDDLGAPVTDAYVELQTRHAHVYSAALHMEAHFTGLRYAMFHWPVASAAIGICTNLFFVAVIFLLSWFHLQDTFGNGKSVKSEEEVDESTFTMCSGKIKLESNLEFDDPRMMLEDSGVAQEEMKNLNSSEC